MLDLVTQANGMTLRMRIALISWSEVEMRGRLWNTLGAECITPQEIRGVCQSLKRDLDRIEQKAIQSFNKHNNALAGESSPQAAVENING